MTNRVGDFGFLLGILVVWTAVGNTRRGDARLRRSCADSMHRRRGVQLRASSSAAPRVAGRRRRPRLRRRDGQERAVPAARLAARRHGGPDARLGADARGHDGRGRRLHDRALASSSSRTPPGRPRSIAWIGGITAFIAATMAITQSDIKKVLAYSTLSQLGYMMMALGAGAYTAAMFHLTTHAFFKALLFLGAGSVIHGCHHEQDMFKMGGLRARDAGHLPDLRDRHAGALRHLPLRRLLVEGRDPRRHGSTPTASAGHTVALRRSGVVTAGLTAFYMGRAWCLTFLGEYRGHAHAAREPEGDDASRCGSSRSSPSSSASSASPGTQNRFEHFLHAWRADAHGAMFHLPVARRLHRRGASAACCSRVAIYRSAEPGTDPLPAKLGRPSGRSGTGSTTSTTSTSGS